MSPPLYRHRVVQNVLTKVGHSWPRFQSWASLMLRGALAGILSRPPMARAMLNSKRLSKKPTPLELLDIFAEVLGYAGDDELPNLPEPEPGIRLDGEGYGDIGLEAPETNTHPTV